ncbi:MAG: histidine phosphatase family protein [Candidatus Hydrogenedentota bacterium]
MSDIAQFISEQDSHCLILARHGETEWNAVGRLQGQQDTSLNEKGMGQASRVARLLAKVSINQIHASTLQRSQKTAQPIAEQNINEPDIFPSPLLKETALGVLEGEMIAQQSTPELTRHYQDFSRDEINYRIPNGENLHDVFARVERFFKAQDQLLKKTGVHVIVGHRNLNKMIIKYLLGLSFEDGFQVEHKHEQLYLYFGTRKELWFCGINGAQSQFTQGHSTIEGGPSYA